jgi:hypothetical protein
MPDTTSELILVLPVRKRVVVSATVPGACG